MRKKLLSVLLVGSLLSTGLLAGCGKQEVSTSSEPKETNVSSEVATTTTEAQKEELEPYTVTWWFGGDESKDHDMVMEKVNERLAELLPNTELEIVMVASAEVQDRWSKAMATGEKIDLIWSCNWSASGVNPYTAVEQEALLPMTDWLEQYGQEMIEGIGGDRVMELHRYNDGEFYFFPSYQGLAAKRSGAYLREDVVALMPDGWLEKAQETAFEHTGYTVEDLNARFDLLEEYMEVAEANDMLGLGLNTNNWEAYLVNGIGITHNIEWLGVVEEDGVFTVYNRFLDDVHQVYNKRMQEWYEKGWIREDIASAEIQNNDTYCLQVKGAVETDWLEVEKTRRVGQGFTWETTGFLLNPLTKMSHGFNTGTVMCYTSENPDRAMQVLSLVNTDPELYNLIVFGIEGTHYLTNADGTITRPASDARTYAGISNWKVGNCVNSLIEAGSDINTYKNKLQQDKEGGVNILANFILDNSEIATEAANISAVYAEYGDWLTIAENDFDYSTLESKLKEAGWDKWQEAVVAQIEEFVSSRNLGTVVVAE